MADKNLQPELPSENPHHSNKTPQELPHQSTDSVALPSVVRAAPKTTWPEVVGMTVEEAERKIREDKPGVQFQVVPQGGFVTMDFNPRRVRLFVDSERKVSRAPRIG